MVAPGGDAPEGARPARWRWVLTALLLIAALAIGGMTLSALLFSRWSSFEVVTPLAAERAFAEASAAAGGGPPYLVVSETGPVTVRHELEREEPVPLEALSLLAWEPDNRRLLRIRFPYWFVQVKMTDTLNLGTLASVLARDWENLDLRVSERDLERLGPGLVLDHRLEDGTRVLLWTE